MELNDKYLDRILKQLTAAPVQGIQLGRFVLVVAQHDFDSCQPKKVILQVGIESVDRARVGGQHRARAGGQHIAGAQFLSEKNNKSEKRVN